MKVKSETFEKFKVWKALVENESDKFLKLFGSDNDGDYVFGEFLDYCKQFGCLLLKWTTLNQSRLLREQIVPNKESSMFKVDIGFVEEILDRSFVNHYSYYEPNSVLIYLYQNFRRSVEMKHH